MLLWNSQPTNGSKGEETACPIIDTGVFQKLRWVLWGTASMQLMLWAHWPPLAAALAAARPRSAAVTAGQQAGSGVQE